MIKRTILPSLQKHLNSEQITILTGPRQVGKTYLMRLLKDQLESEGHQTVWLNLDIEQDSKKLNTQEELLTYLDLQSNNKKLYVFIDEIQQKVNSGKFLKGIYDMQKPYKFIISGSGSLELKSDIVESMAGRKQVFAIPPISFNEFVDHKTKYQYENRLTKFYQVEPELSLKYLNEYMIYGGYPRVILANNPIDKQKEMQEIFQSYIDKDIQRVLHLEKSESLIQLLKIIASQIGSLVTISELSSTLNLNERTVKNYLWYLEQTFIINKVTPFFRNVRSEITKTPQYFFVDNGLRNWMLGLFSLPEIPATLSGHLFENVIFNIIKSKIELSPTQIHFWRTKTQAEVDFVLVSGLEIIPYEIKYAKLDKPKIEQSLKNFVQKYHPTQAYIIHRGQHYETTIGNCQFTFMSFAELSGKSLLD